MVNDRHMPYEQYYIYIEIGLSMLRQFLLRIYTWVKTSPRNPDKVVYLHPVVGYQEHTRLTWIRSYRSFDVDTLKASLEVHCSTPWVSNDTCLHACGNNGRGQCLNYCRYNVWYGINMQYNLVWSTGLIMWIGHRKDIRDRKLTFRALAFLNRHSLNLHGIKVKERFSFK